MNAQCNLSILITIIKFRSFIHHDRIVYIEFPKFRFPALVIVLLCGCETWSLTLREESRLRVFENRILIEANIWAQEG